MKYLTYFFILGLIFFNFQFNILAFELTYIDINDSEIIEKSEKISLTNNNSISSEKIFNYSKIQNDTDTKSSNFIISKPSDDFADETEILNVLVQTNNLVFTETDTNISQFNSDGISDSTGDINFNKKNSYQPLAMSDNTEIYDNFSVSNNSVSNSAENTDRLDYVDLDMPQRIYVPVNTVGAGANTNLQNRNRDNSKTFIRGRLNLNEFNYQRFRVDLNLTQEDINELINFKASSGKITNLNDLKKLICKYKNNE